MLRGLLTAILALGLLSAASLGALARVDVRIDLTAQRMNVSVDGVPRHSWPISSGRRGFRTPTGSYRPTVLRRMHYSSKYNNAPMPFSIFFRGGYAIHGTTEVQMLGRPASHGCVRLAPSNARMLFELVQARGAGQTRIRVAY